MTAPTHIAFGNIFFFTIAKVLGVPLNAITVSIVSLGSLLPDIDTPTSALGRTIFPLARWIEGRWGHRTITHSFVGLLGFAIICLPLLYWRPPFYIALLIGIISHPLIDIANTTGVALVWPSEKRVVFPYVEKHPTKFRIMVGSLHEMVLLGVLIVLLTLFYPVGQFGFRRVLHYLLAHPKGAIDDYRMIAGTRKVFALVRAIDLLTQEHFEGKYEVLGSIGESTLIIRKDGELYTLGPTRDCNFYPIKVRIKEGKRVNIVTQEIDMSGRLIGDIRFFVDPKREQYLYGALNVEGDPKLMYKHRCYNTIFKKRDYIMLNIASWEDIKEAKIEDIYVTNGKITIKTLLPEGEVFETKDMIRAAIERRNYQKMVTVSFHIQSFNDLLVEEKDRIRVGQVLARVQDELEKAREKKQNLEILRKEREAIKQVVETSVKEIQLKIQEKETMLRKIESEERENTKLYESGIIGIRDYQAYEKERKRIEAQLKMLKVDLEKERAKGEAKLIVIDRRVQDLEEEINEHLERAIVRSKVEGVIMGTSFFNTEDRIKVILEVLVNISTKEGECGGL
jgi:inner membrane protein